MRMLPVAFARVENAFFSLLEKLMVALLAGMVLMVFGNVVLRWVANSGIVVNKLSPAEQKRLRETVKPVYEKHATTIGKEMVDKMNAALTKVRGS